MSNNSALAALLREQAKERREREDEKSSMFGFLRGLDPSFDDRSKPGFGVKSDDPLYNIANMLREMFGEQTEVEKYDSNLENRLKEADGIWDKTRIYAGKPGQSPTEVARLLELANQQEERGKKRQEVEELEQKKKQWEERGKEVLETGSLADKIKYWGEDPTLTSQGKTSLGEREDHQRRLENTRVAWEAFNAQNLHPTSQQIRGWRKAQEVLNPFVPLDFIIPTLNTAMTSEAVAIQRNYYKEGDTLPLAQQKKMLREMRDGELTETVTYQLAWREYTANQRAKKDYDQAATKMRIALVPTPSQTEAGRKGFDMAEEFRKLGEPYPPAGDVDKLKIYGHRNAVHIYNGEWSQRQILRTLATENPDGDIFERTLEYVQINPTLVVDLMKLKVDGKLNFFYNRDEPNSGEFKSSDFQRILGEIMGERVKDKPWFNFQDKPKQGESDEEVKARKRRALILLSALNEKDLISPFLMVKTHDGEMMSWWNYRPKAMEIHQKSKKALLPGSTTDVPKLKNKKDKLKLLQSYPPSPYPGTRRYRAATINRLEMEIEDMEEERAIPVTISQLQDELERERNSPPTDIGYGYLEFEELSAWRGRMDRLKIKINDLRKRMGEEPLYRVGKYVRDSGRKDTPGKRGN